MESPRGVDTTINPSPVLVPKQSSQVQSEIVDSPEIVVSQDGLIHEFNKKTKSKYVSIALPHHMKKAIDKWVNENANNNRETDGQIFAKTYVENQ